MTALSDFTNEPVAELRRAPARDKLLEALRALDATLPLEVPILVGGDRGATTGLTSTDPGEPERVVATAGMGGAADAAAAVEAAQRGFRDWGARPAAERAGVLRAAAAELRERRAELAALMVRECAKPWPEADADVCEAIDFLEYYALAAPALERGPELAQVPGERNTMRYAPARGGGGDRAVELPAGHPHRHDRGRAGGGQRRGAQAGRAVARLRAGARARRCTARAFRPTRWRCCPARPRPAGRWSSTRACT